MPENTASKETIFFMMVFLLFFLSCKLSCYLEKNIPEINADLRIAVVGLGFTAIVVALFFIAKSKDTKDNYLHLQNLKISPGALCRGGPYMWQSNSDETAKMCREMAKTEEGRCQIADYECPSGYNGVPGVGLEFTSNSNSCWDGVKCKGNKVDKAYYDKLKPKNDDCSLCSMWTNEN